MSLSLYTVIAEQLKKTLRQQPKKAAAGTMHSAMHGQTGRSGCTPAEPYPPSRKLILHRKSKYFKTCH
jgi:hypothetical protein